MYTTIVVFRPEFDGREFSHVEVRGVLVVLTALNPEQVTKLVEEKYGKYWDWEYSELKVLEA